MSLDDGYDGRILSVNGVNFTVLTGKYSQKSNNSSNS